MYAQKYNSPGKNTSEGGFWHQNEVLNEKKEDPSIPNLFPKILLQEAQKDKG